MSFASSWGKMLPPSYRNVDTQATTTSVNNADFDREFEEFCKLQRQQKAEREAKAAEEAKQEAEAVAEEAYQAFVEEAEKPKSKKKKKTEAVVEETSDETPVVED
jgi:hypothetical protein